MMASVLFRVKHRKVLQQISRRLLADIENVLEVSEGWKGWSSKVAGGYVAKYVVAAPRTLF